MTAPAKQTKTPTSHGIAKLRFERLLRGVADTGTGTVPIPIAGPPPYGCAGSVPAVTGWAAVRRRGSCIVSVDRRSVSLCVCVSLCLSCPFAQDQRPQDRLLVYHGPVVASNSAPFCFVSVWVVFLSFVFDSRNGTSLFTNMSSGRRVDALSHLASCHLERKWGFNTS